MLQYEYAELYNSEKYSTTEPESIENEEFDVNDLAGDLSTELVISNEGINESVKSATETAQNSGIQSVYSPKYVKHYLPYELPKIGYN